MTTVLNININDLSTQLIRELKNRFDKTTQIEIRIDTQEQSVELLSETQFWQIIALIDWKKELYTDILAPCVAALAKMPVANIYVFQDKLSEKLYHLDTKAHIAEYVAKDPDHFLSVDDFLYVRCAVVAEGQFYYENVLKNPSEMPFEIAFEPLLSLASDAYKMKTGKKFDYFPVFNYETGSNKENR
jgi:Protein of unknown function (DUF4240)